MIRGAAKDKKCDNFLEILRTRAEKQPSSPAYVFLADGETETGRLTFTELDRQARAIAAHLQGLGLAGERILLLYPPGLGFVAAFFGCLYAGALAVPAFPPRPNRPQPRLRAILRDAQPRAALATASLVAGLEGLREHVPELAGITWVATDELDGGLADLWREPDLGPDDLAFLQYTSGSTSTPKGVMVSHGNLVHNEAVIQSAFGQSEESVIVGWLPLYHDMGLIGNVLQPLYLGASCVLMPPVAFLQKPARWLEAISRYGATTSGGPNFAYDLCTRKVADDVLEGLDLSRWSVAFNGAEPVRAYVHS